MKPIKVHTGIVAPLDRANVDTDAIIPKQFLKKIDRVGFGKHLFHEWRYTDYAGTKENPGFILNQPVFRKASILLARENFGCGSSREHAPWALADYGFRVIIAPSFADIFYNNALKNGILLVRLDAASVHELFAQVKASPGCTFTADLEKQVILDVKKNVHPFEIHPFVKHCLVNGLDQIGWTLKFEKEIDDYEKELRQQRPWAA